MIGAMFMAGKFKEADCETCDPVIKEKCQRGEHIEWNQGFYIKGVEYTGCPREHLDTSWHPVFQIYQMCRTMTEGRPQPNGILPLAGGALNQPNILMEAFSIIDQVILECRPKK